MLFRKDKILHGTVAKQHKHLQWQLASLIMWKISRINNKQEMHAFMLTVRLSIRVVMVVDLDLRGSMDVRQRNVVHKLVRWPLAPAALDSQPTKISYQSLLNQVVWSDLILLILLLMDFPHLLLSEVKVIINDKLPESLLKKKISVMKKWFLSLFLLRSKATMNSIPEDQEDKDHPPVKKPIQQHSSNIKTLEQQALLRDLKTVSMTISLVFICSKASCNHQLLQLHQFVK